MTEREEEYDYSHLVEDDDTEQGCVECGKLRRKVVDLQRRIVKMKSKKRRKK